MLTDLISTLNTPMRRHVVPASSSPQTGVRAQGTLSALSQNDRVDITGDAEDAADIKETPEVQRYSREKSMALEAFERLKEELKIVRKVWANDPEELAAQLVRLGKQLAKLVKQYQSAQKALADILGQQSGGALTMPSLFVPPSSADSGSVLMQGEISADDVKSDADMLATDVPERKQLTAVQSQGLTAYQKASGKSIRLDETPFAMALRGDIEFVHGFREFATKLRETLEYSQKRAPNLPGHSEDRDAFMEDAHEFLEDLEKELFKYEGALKGAMPPAVFVTG